MTIFRIAIVEAGDHEMGDKFAERDIEANLGMEFGV